MRWWSVLALAACTTGTDDLTRGMRDAGGAPDAGDAIDAGDAGPTIEQLARAFATESCGWELACCSAEDLAGREVYVDVESCIAVRAPESARALEEERVAIEEGRLVIVEGVMSACVRALHEVECRGYAERRDWEGARINVECDGLFAGTLAIGAPCPLDGGDRACEPNASCEVPAGGTDGGVGVCARLPATPGKQACEQMVCGESAYCDPQRGACVPAPPAIGDPMPQACDGI